MIATRLNMRFPGERVKAVTLSYDDQTEQDIKLVEILNKSGMRATFNISTGLYSSESKQFGKEQVCRRMTRQRAIALYKNSGHEVAVHGYSHALLTQMPVSSVTREVFADRINLEADFETDVRGMAYAFGDASYGEDVANALKACGIVYSRMTSSTGKFRLPTDWYRWYPTCMHRETCLMELAKKFVENTTNKEPMLFYLWGHSFEFDEDDNWNVIENFCELIGNRDDIWYATNIEIYDYVQAYRRLVWTADMRRVYNPSAIPVSFQYHTIEDSGEIKQTYTVGAGEALVLTQSMEA
ncbi:MAG: polysaccharide deacetylase family protein [Clostridia bacterium]|nr:polysaccharide deacetylase family protein [Clostridia bacterium]